MKGENFIRVIDGAMALEKCAKIINEFCDFNSNGGTYSRLEGEGAPNTLKADTSADFADLIIDALHTQIKRDVLVMLNKHITEYVNAYEAGMFSGLYGDTYPMSQTLIKIQATKPSEGYHVWHSESAANIVKGRFLAWILYLNDIDEGGETEFLYLSERVKPKTGRLVIFPAGFTHAHRGNPPLSDVKYIMTGWMEHTL